MAASSGCAYKSASVRHKPVNLAPYGGERFDLFMWITPRPHAEFLLVVDLPGGEKAMLYPAEALLASYKEALSVVFKVGDRYKYSDFTALVPLEEMELSASFEPESPSPGEEVAMSLSVSHTVTTVDNHTTLRVQKIPLRKERRVTFPYAGPSRTLERVAFLLEDLLAEMERDLHAELEAGLGAGKYVVWH
jgi:hypothetical protein